MFRVYVDTINAKCGHSITAAICYEVGTKKKFDQAKLVAKLMSSLEENVICMECKNKERKVTLEGFLKNISSINNVFI